MHKKICIFDFDGTLVNTIEDVAICFNKSLEKFGFNSHPIKTYNNLTQESKDIMTKTLSAFFKIGKDNILVGNETLLKENNIIFQPSKDIGTIIYASKNDEFLGYIVISDKIKNNNFSELKKQVNKEIIILSGDNKKQVAEIAKGLGVNTYFYNLLPIDKVKKVESYKKNGTTIFVGDGINDAPVLKIADVGISMGNLGSEAAIEASDIVLMNDNINNINKLIDIAKTTKKKVKNSIIFSLLVKFIVLLLGLLGKSTMLLAVFADVGVTLLVIIYVLTIYIEN